MANITTKTLLLILAVGLVMVMMGGISAVEGGGGMELGVGPMMMMSKGCKGGSVGECLGDDVEFEMDSEIHRRILANTRYISYGALNRNRVPCSRRGASYYNCRPGAQANPYRRGCSAITRCARR